MTPLRVFQALRVPRASGDEPFSRADNRFIDQVFPAPAGMNPLKPRRTNP